MNYDQALKYTQDKGAATLRWMLANGRAEERHAPQKKEEKRQRRINLLRKAGIDV